MVTSWYSPHLNKEMPIATYGHYGFALLLIPTAAADFEEYERFHLIEALRPFIDSGKLKVYSINSINKESWMNKQIEGAHRAIRQNQFNEYVTREVIPYIRNGSSDDTFIYTCGASFGALHAMNLFLKFPGLINGTISMSGVYDLTEYSNGYWDDQVFLNSPCHYIPALNNEEHLARIKASHHIHIYTGSGAYEDPQANRHFSQVLWNKGIWHDLDIWGPDVTHDWPTWRKMLPHILSSRF